MLNKVVFKDFNEYWYYARYLSEKQRSIIFSNLSKYQKKCLEHSYINDGWGDLFYRNEIDSILDELKKDYGYDILLLRSKVLKGKSVYVPSEYWNALEESLSQFTLESTYYIMSGIRGVICDKNKDVVLIISD